ncbi:MAG: hypothetical protein AAFX99_07805 [Myxococcota bacterium]
MSWNHTGRRYIPSHQHASPITTISPTPTHAQSQPPRQRRRARPRPIPHLGALFRLFIGPCNLTDEGLKALWNSTHLTSLKDLRTTRSTYRFVAHHGRRYS